MSTDSTEEQSSDQSQTNEITSADGKSEFEKLDASEQLSLAGEFYMCPKH